MTVFGLKSYDSGSVTLDGKILPKGRPFKTKELGLAYIPKDRGGSLFYQFELYKNITLPYLAQVLGPGFNWILKPKRERDVTGRQMQQYTIKAAGPDALLSSLSGGNQQKVAIAKLVISMEPETILDLSDRILIFSRGRIVHELKDTEASKIKILELS